MSPTKPGDAGLGAQMPSHAFLIAAFMPAVAAMARLALPRVPAVTTASAIGLIFVIFNAPYLGCVLRAAPVSALSVRQPH